MAEQPVDAMVLAPADPASPCHERSEGLEVRRLRYFWPASLQRLAYNAGIPWNLQHNWVAWANLPFFLLSFLVGLIRHATHVDVIHAHWGVMGALAILVRPMVRRPVVLTVHGSDWRSPRALIRGITRWAVCRADAVTTPSPEFYEEFLQIRRAASRCYFIPNGVEFPTLEEMARRRVVCRGPVASPHVISVGRLIPERHHDRLIRAFARVRRETGTGMLTVIGAGPCAHALQELTERLGLADVVRLTGALAPEEVLRRLAGADLYVSPTDIESFGMAVLEAAALGLPVITTRVGYAATLVVEGETGYTVPPGDEEALVKAMHAMLVAPPDFRRQAGRRMRERVHALGLTWSGVAQQMAYLYQSLAAHGSAGEAAGKGAGTREM
ncbi:MAG: glycosyltransferase [Planctomycetes bacterium]|nr:glycosyltransferase [Planctomycetota bacterium]